MEIKCEIVILKRRQVICYNINDYSVKIYFIEYKTIDLFLHYRFDFITSTKS